MKKDYKDLAEKGLRVRPIKYGTVIDHIPAGQGLHVLNILNITSKTKETVSIVLGVPSKLIGQKDIVKVENRILNTKEADKIALIASTATVNLIENWEVVEKHKVVLPEKIEGVVKCLNPGCISNTKEPVIPKFIRWQNTIRCCYCEVIIPQEKLGELII